MEDFQLWKMALVSLTGLSKDALHIHIGMAIFLLCRLVWRGRAPWLMAWLTALIITLCGEWLDWQSASAMPAIPDYYDPERDIANTLAWPTVLALLGSWWERRERALAQEPSGDDADQPLE